MSNRFVIICFFCVAATFGFSSETQSLSAILKNGHPGDYVVTKSNKIITLIHIHSITSSSITFEEISAPAKRCNLGNRSWSDWVKAKAPGHTSWSMTEIAWDSGEIIRSYSFSRHAYLRASPQESLLATLLHRPLGKLPLTERRRIGSPPLEGEADHRHYWNPPVIFQGTKMDKADCEALTTTWPDDGSDLAGHQLTLYFDKGRKVPLPYWIELQTTAIDFHVQTIDSGASLQSPFTGFPNEQRYGDRG